MDINQLNDPIVIGIAIYIITAMGLFLVTRESTEKSFAIFSFVPIMNIYLLSKLSWHDVGMFLIILTTPLLALYNPILILISVVLYWYIIILIWAKTGASFIYTTIAIPLPTVGFYLMWDSIKDNRDIDTEFRYERTEICPNCKFLCGTDKIKTNKIKCKECGEWVNFKPLPKGIDQNIRRMTKNKKPIEIVIREEERDEQEERLIREYKENFEKKY